MTTHKLSGDPRIPEQTRVTAGQPVSSTDAAAKNDVHTAALSAEVSNLKLRIRALNAANINLKRRVKELETQTLRK